MSPLNPNSILFLYEGDTEREFYNRIFDIYVPQRRIRIHKSNLSGIHSINKKVKNKIGTYLQHEKYLGCNKIFVIVAHDREGTRDKESSLNIELLENDFVKVKNSRVMAIREIIATQDLESWLFHDIENIFEFLKTPKSQRTVKHYQNVEQRNYRELSKLFHRFGKHYQKGQKIEGFINSLDLEKIYSKTPDLREGIEFIINLCK